MANLNTILRTEIARISQRAYKSSVAPLRKMASDGRKENAVLRRRVAQLERQVRDLARTIARIGQGGRAGAASAAAPESGKAALRFRPQGMASHRARLGLSASEFGRLVGASAKSVYAWEQGKSRPRASHLARIAELRSMGKREAHRRLAG